MTGGRDGPRATQAEEVAASAPGPQWHRVICRRAAESPHVFIGSVEGLIEKFTRLREELGISSVMVGEVDELRPVVERLAGT